MLEEALHQLIEKIQRRGCEEQTMEVKAAHHGCPEKLYDTLSAFANQDDGGILVFGLDETKNFEKVGVYDAQELQKKVMEYGEQMTPVVRPVFTVYDENGKVFVAAEIPPCDITERPCFNTARGRMKGAYKRVGDADKPMTEYEVYSYEAFRKRYRDDVRPVDEVSLQLLNKEQLEDYRSKKREERPNLARLTEAQQDELNGIIHNGCVTMTGLLLFGLFPQARFPRLCISATVIPGRSIGELDEEGNRFTNTKRIEGTICEMLHSALDFVRRNMRTAIAINPTTGQRIDIPEYPMAAVREALLNALVHRDYSIYTEGKAIQLNLYTDRMEIINPGGLYGRLTVDQLGKVQPDTRNPVLATAMEVLNETENRYTGIPTIRHAMHQRGLPEPVFISTGSEFKVILYHEPKETANTPKDTNAKLPTDDEKQLLLFCRTPRTRAEILTHLGIHSWQYALQRYVGPLLRNATLRMTLPKSPRSRSQKYVTAEREG